VARQRRRVSPTQGDTMYLNLKDVTTEIRTELKRMYPAWKFSVTIAPGGHAICVALMAGPVSPFADPQPTDGYAQLNHRYLKELCNGHNITPAAVEMLQQVTEISNRHNWDNSDIQSDYFDVGYYFSLHIGKWDRPFEIVTK
jgi:hypothetical protein